MLLSKLYGIPNLLYHDNNKNNYNYAQIAYMQVSIQRETEQIKNESIVKWFLLGLHHLGICIIYLSRLNYDIVTLHGCNSLMWRHLGSKTSRYLLAL